MATRKNAFAGLDLSLETGAATSGNKDRSQPLSEVSGKWATAYADRVRSRDVVGAMPPHDVLAKGIEDSALKAVREELLRMAADLTARAKRLTADEVRVIAKHDGAAAALKVTAMAPEEVPPGVWCQSHVRVTVEPQSDLGASLRALGVAPRENAPKKAAAV